MTILIATSFFHPRGRGNFGFLGIERKMQPSLVKKNQSRLEVFRNYREETLYFVVEYRGKFWTLSCDGNGKLTKQSSND